VLPWCHYNDKLAFDDATREVESPEAAGEEIELWEEEDDRVCAADLEDSANNDGIEQSSSSSTKEG